MQPIVGLENAHALTLGEALGALLGKMNSEASEPDASCQSAHEPTTVADDEIVIHADIRHRAARVALTA